MVAGDVRRYSDRNAAPCDRKKSRRVKRRFGSGLHMIGSQHAEAADILAQQIE